MTRCYFSGEGFDFDYVIEVDHLQVYDYQCNFNDPFQTHHRNANRLSSLVAQPLALSRVHLVDLLHEGGARGKQRIDALTTEHHRYYKHYEEPGQEAGKLDRILVAGGGQRDTTVASNVELCHKAVVTVLEQNFLVGGEFLPNGDGEVFTSCLCGLDVALKGSIDIG